MTEQKKPMVNSAGERELIKMEEKFEEFKQEVKELSSTNLALPKLETENQTKLSARDLDKSKEIYLKPSKSIGPGKGEKFNEAFREEYTFRKEYVNFIAENSILGETIEIWTKPFPGMNCDYWEVPVNKPVWGPRFLAEQIASRSYVVYEMNEVSDQERYMPQNKIESNFAGGIYGKIVGKRIENRMKAFPVSQRKSIFMGETAFKSA